ncbi:hypothetical protein L7F22_042274 [Adiantum nelumboides]|nr:hypothetical protein [Adiantum nelumboides]
MTTTNWKALLAVTIITLTLSKVNGLPISSSLQRKELQQNLGPSGSTVDGDLGTVGTTVEGLTSSLGLSSRQALDNLSGALQTNDLYDGLTGTRKRSPLVFNSPLAVGGSSKGSPAAQTGGVDAGTDDSDSRRKRSPLVFNSPLAVGGSSKGSPAGETGGISGNQLHSDTKGTTNSLEDDDNHIDGHTSDGTNKLSSQLGSDVNKMIQNKRSPLAGQLGGLTQDLPFGSILGGNSGEDDGSANGNVTPHSVSEAPEEDEQDLPEGKTQKSGTDIGAHLMGGDKKPDMIKIENTGKDATNNHGASRGKTGLSSSIGGDKATKLNLEQKTKDRMNGGEEEGTKGKSSDVGLQTGGGKSTDLDIKNNQSKKTNDYSSRR